MTMGLRWSIQSERYNRFNIMRHKTALSFSVKKGCGSLLGNFRGLCISASPERAILCIDFNMDNFLLYCMSFSLLFLSFHIRIQ